MAVMDYIESTPIIPSDAREKIEEILMDLHSEGYVFGDLRRPNILFDKTGEVFLIDFNWSGRYDMRSHDGIPEPLQKCIEEKLATVGCVDREYVRYPYTVCVGDDMWVDGVKVGRSILPKHDWGMLRKIDFDT
jgi:serine/threonine protein kinase